MNKFKSWHGLTGLSALASGLLFLDHSLTGLVVAQSQACGYFTPCYKVKTVSIPEEDAPYSDWRADTDAGYRAADSEALRKCEEQAKARKETCLATAKQWCSTDCDVNKQCKCKTEMVDSPRCDRFDVERNNAQHPNQVRVKYKHSYGECKATCFGDYAAEEPVEEPIEAVLSILNPE